MNDDSGLSDELERSLEVVHAINTGRPVNCLACNVTFLDARDGLEHLRRHSRAAHPSNHRPQRGDTA